MHIHRTDTMLLGWGLILIAAVIIIMAVLANGGCAFESEDPIYIEGNIDNEGKGDTYYKLVYFGACGFDVRVVADISDEYAHYREDMHYFGVFYGKHERGDFGAYDDLVVGIPCGACTVRGGIAAYLGVLDDKNQIQPWGWGRQRPPLNGVTRFEATYIAEDVQYIESVEATNVVTSRFEGEPLAFDIIGACEVLVQAGVLE